MRATSVLIVASLAQTPATTRVLSALTQVKAHGSYWTARCPAHEDAVASLSISTGRDGRVLLKCHANCQTEAIVAKVGLTMADLWPESRPAKTATPVPDGADAGDRPTLTKTYDYTDASGAVLFQSCRFLRSDGKKTFRQRRPDGNGGWTWSIGDVPLVLYRLPDITAAVESGRPVYVVEGEKDADALAELGYAATTNPMGAGKWSETFSATLRGAEIVILPDNDAPGRSHAEQVAASLTAQGCTVRVVALPNLPVKGDVSDWLAAGHSLETMEELIGKTRLWQPDQRTKFVWRLDEILSNDDLMRPPPPIIPRMAWRGRSTLLSAAYKAGKSTLTGFLAAQVSTGGLFLGDPCLQGPVLIVALEEALGDIGRRLHHFRADPKRVHIVCRLPADPETRPQTMFGYIEQFKPSLLIVDTLIAYGRGQIENENDASQTQPVVQELTDVAHSADVGMVIVHHANKTGGTRGSSAIPGAVDVIVEISKPDEKGDPTMRKANCLGRMPVHNFEFRYDGVQYNLANDIGRPLIQRVLDFIRGNPQKSTTAIRAAIGGKAELVDEAINALLQRRFIYDRGDAYGHAYEASTAAPASI